jgi:hypothetical protein
MPDHRRRCRYQTPKMTTSLMSTLFVIVEGLKVVAVRWCCEGGFGLSQASSWLEASQVVASRPATSRSSCHSAWSVATGDVPGRAVVAVVYMVEEETEIAVAVQVAAVAMTERSAVSEQEAAVGVETVGAEGFATVLVEVVAVGTMAGREAHCSDVAGLLSAAQESAVEDAGVDVECLSRLDDGGDDADAVVALHSALLCLRLCQAH